jgi:hypothetical protein
MVVRVDGLIKNALDSQGASGFPCGVALVRYTIGGLTREIMVDAVTESGLTVWAESIDVTAVRDEVRIARLAASVSGAVLPCTEQAIAAAISGCECGDTGFTNARYLDMVNLVDSDAAQVVAFKVPPNARVLRLLNTLDNAGAVLDWFGSHVIGLQFWAIAPGVGLIEAVKPPKASVAVPADARFMTFNVNATGSDTAEQPIWVEWIMGTATPYTV